jgi:hypothetical protein
MLLHRDETSHGIRFDVSPLFWDMLLLHREEAFHCITLVISSLFWDASSTEPKL